MFAAPLLVQQRHQAVEDQPCGNVVVSEIDEFKDTPRIEDREGRLADCEELLMERGPFLEGVVTFLALVLVLEDDLLELLLFNVLGATRLLRPLALLHSL